MALESKLTKRPKRRGGRGSSLTPTDKAWVYQTYMLTQNAKRTAEYCGVNVLTVRKVLKSMQELDAEANPTVRQARAAVAERMAGKILVKAEEVLDSITPTDLESGRFPIKDKDGNITGYTHYGPALSQKALALGIVLDKAVVAEQLQKTILQDQRAGDLLLPQDLDGLRDAIMNKAKSLRFLQVEFEPSAPSVLDRAQEIVARVEAAKDATPKILDFDLDNPGVAQK